MKDILIVCATPFTEDEFFKQSPLAKYINDYVYYDIDNNGHDCALVFENQKGLPMVYNNFLKEKENKNKILVFVHDDVSIEDAFLYKKLNEAITHFDIIGLAGGSKVKIQSPSLWHLLTDKKTQTGAVAHQWPNGIVGVSTYGPTPQRCLITDGLFLAINTEKVQGAGLWFDPNYDFHHWDLQFGLDANNLKLKTGTWPIWVTHQGLGDSYMSDAWRESEKTFLRVNS